MAGVFRGVFRTQLKKGGHNKVEFHVTVKYANQRTIFVMNVEGLSLTTPKEEIRKKVVDNFLSSVELEIVEEGGEKY